MTERPVVLLTGCTRPTGLGWQAARELLSRGFRVLATVRRPEEVTPVVAGVPDGLPGDAAALLRVRVLDLLVPETVDAVVDELAAENGPDVLVNNAGYGLIGGIEQCTIEQARKVMEVDFLATMALVQKVLPGMRARRSGHIVNVSSVFVPGLCPPTIGWYIAAKAALEAAGHALAIEMAPFGVRVTNFQPGPVDTALERDWGNRFPDGEDPQPGLADRLYGWVTSPDAPALQSPAEVAVSLADLLELPDPPLAWQSGKAALGYVAAALRDPGRQPELSAALPLFDRPGAAAEAGQPQ